MKSSPEEDERASKPATLSSRATARRKSASSSTIAISRLLVSVIAWAMVRREPVDCLDSPRQGFDTWLVDFPGDASDTVNRRPMISVAATTGLLDAIRAAGVNPEPLIREAGLDRSVFSNPDGYIATSAFAGLLEEAARATGDDCFGLHFGERFNPRDVGALAYVVL